MQQKDLRRLIPNSLTLIRVVLTCFLSCYLLKCFGRNDIIPVTILAILLTDFLDGKIARHYGVVSSAGAIFDVVADLFFIIIINGIFCYFGVLPIWFLFVIVFKFVEFVISSKLLRRYSNENPIFIFDFLGKSAAAAFYFTPIIAYTSYIYFAKEYICIINTFISIATLMVLASSLYRICKCIKLQKVQCEKKYSEQTIQNRREESVLTK